MTFPPLKIKNLSFSPIVSAPMAGVTDKPMREMIRLFGNELLYSEMVSATSLVNAHKRTNEMALCDETENPIAVQIEGHCPKTMAKAAEIITEKSKAAFIDINMGCPVQKVVKNGAGSALMKTPELASEIVKEVTKATNLPVTVKFRLGWDDDDKNYLDFGKLMQDSGADAVTLHARTRQQFYSGSADWTAIKALKETLDIPVIGNGDIRSPLDAQNMLEQTKADGAMIGRGLFGKPYLLALCHRFLYKQSPFEIPKTSDLILWHFEKMKNYYGAKAIFIARKHIAWYSLGIEQGASFREQVNKITDEAELFDLINDFFNQAEQK